MKPEWYFDLLEPDEAFERHLPDGQRRNLDALRKACLEHGPTRGVIAKGAEIAGIAINNFHFSLRTVAARKAKIKALKNLNVEALPGMTPRQITRRLAADGRLLGSSVQERPTEDSPPIEATVAGFAVSKVSTFRSADGEIIARWTQERPEEARRIRLLEEAIDNRIANVPALPPTPATVASVENDTLVQITIADGHLNALAWPKETGSAPWDLKVSERTMGAGVDWLCQALPMASELLIVILGDFLETDGYLPLTPKSGHLVDADGRYPNVADVAERCVERAVRRGLERYPRVRLVIKPGNHDKQSMMWLRKLMLRVFENEPRVTVEPSIRPYWAMEFGDNMVSTHHGDLVKLEQLPSVFAADFAPLWGRTKHRYAHSGHLHHKHMVLHVGKELRGMMVIQHPTMASRNAWAGDQGLTAARELLGHVYHRRAGLRSTIHWSPDMMAEAA